MIPITECLAAVYPVVPGPAIIELTEAQLTIDPCCGGRPSSLCLWYEPISQLTSTSHTTVDLHFQGILLKHLPELVFVADENSNAVDLDDLAPILNVCIPRHL